MTWVNYQQLREELRIEEVIAHYGIELVGSGEQHKCVCPFEGCNGGEKKSLSVNLKKNLWKCWACETHGNVIDFAARCEGLDPLDTKEFRRVALILQERHGITPQKPEQTAKRQSVMKNSKASGQSRKACRKRLVNQPLDFTLKGLDPEHESLAGLGLSLATIEHFGLGYCTRPGMFQGRITAPIHDGDGRLVGYTGKLSDESAVGPDKPLWLLPDQERIRKQDNTALVFDPTRLVYHSHAIEEPVANLIVVEGPGRVWHLYEQQVESVVALLKGASTEQASIICDCVQPDGCVWFLTFAGKPLESLAQVACKRPVRWLVTESEADLDQHIQDIFG